MGGLSQSSGDEPGQVADPINADDRALTYGAALGLLFDATCVIDPSLTVLDCDKGFLGLLGLSQEHVVGHPIPALNLTGSVDGEPVTLRHVARLGSWRGHTTLARQDGSELSMDTLLIKSSGDLPRLHLFFRDVRGPLSVQVGEVDHQHALAQVGRLSALAEMTSGIAHEMNQPLAAIVNYANGCVSLINQDRAEDQVLVRALTAIADQSRRAAEIIRRMRAFARRSDGQRESFHLSELLKDALGVSEPHRRRVGIEVQCEFAAPNDEIVADGIQIEQVMLHLIRNASDSLAAIDGDQPRIIRVTTRELTGTGNEVSMIETTVTDSGPPIPEDREVRLFAPFETTRENGLGLGLVISRSIIEAHGGKLHYLGCSESPPGGPSFCFTLPLRAAPI